ncbi:MAG: CARDB domain-containing protein [Candidatus Bathyarchaeia archaeon]
MKKIKSAILVVLILLSSSMVSPSIFFLVRADSTSPAVLEFNAFDDLEILEGEDTILIILKHNIVIPTSPLAEIYRKALDVTNDIGEEEIPIPVRKQFYEALYQEYDFSLGLDTLIMNSSIVPRGNFNECRIYVDAVAFPRVLTTMPGSTGDSWSIRFGPTNPTRFAEYIFTQVTFLKMLLQRLPDEQVYRSFWSIRIIIPEDATLLNSDEISGLNWLVDLGGGNSLMASLFVEKSSIILNETLTVTEKDITMPITDVCDAFQGYKSFLIEYSLSETEENEIDENVADQQLLFSAADISSASVSTTKHATADSTYDGDFSWSYTWSIINEDISGSILIPFEVPPGSYAKYNGHLELSATFYISWEPTLPIFGLKSFKSSIRTDAKLELDVEACIKAEYSNEEEPWTLPLFEYSYPVTFFIGPVPVEVSLEFSVEARLSVNFEAEMTITAGYRATGWLESGVRYNLNTMQLEGFSDRSMSSEFIPPAGEVSVSIEIRPSLAFDIWAKFYEVAGPHVEFELYLSISASLTQSSTFELNVVIGLQISVGFRFDDNLKKLLKLEDYGPKTIADIVLLEYVWRTHHDVAITNVMISKTNIYRGDIVDISVTVKNMGYTIEHDAVSFDVKVQYDDSEIGTQSVSNLAESSETTVVFTWDTSTAPTGELTIKAELLNINPAEEVDENDYAKNNIFETKVEISPVDFYITYAPETTWYKPGETTKTIVEVKNLRPVRTTFWLGVSFKDPTGEFEKYDPQISKVPESASLEPGETATFTVTWTIPVDAPFGWYTCYQIALNCWKDNIFKEKYVDNIEWADVFYVYKLQIILPKTESPASAGDPNNPKPIIVSVKWIPTMLSNLLLKKSDFSVRIGNQFAACEIQPSGSMSLDDIVATFKRFVLGLYELKVYPPTQQSQGFYNLTVTVTMGELTDSDMATSAVEYVSGPSVEPIEKGLAWLRTRQSGDGSWRGSVGVTSLVALAFLNAGYDETDLTVRKAINYILSWVHYDGSIYTSYPVYETSTAILALVATHNASYTTIIENAKNWLVGAQQDETFGYTPANYQYGGWTYYSSRGDPDLSNTQFALLALDAANLPKTDPTWSKAIIFTQRCQNRPTSNDQAWAHDSSRPSYNDGGFIYRPWGWSLAGGTLSYGSMTGAGIWSLLLSGVPKTDERVTAAINWVANHYTWDTNPVYGSRPYYYYLTMAKALTMYGVSMIDGHDWYQDLYNKLVGMQINAGPGLGYWSTSSEDYNPDLTTAYAILSLQTKAAAQPVERLSYLTFILRSNCLIRVIDPDGNLVGYNSITGRGENNIPTAVYLGPFSETQIIIIIKPKAGTYRLELIGISEGPFELTIQGSYGEEVMDVFEYTGEIKPAELYGCDVTVTAIVGPIDVYASPPEFEEIIDNIPPTTTLNIGKPKYVSPTDNIYVSSATQFTLTAEDNPGGTGVASTLYRIYNSTYDTGWLEYSAPFYLIGLADGEYSIDFYSVDNVGNTEPTNTVTVILDNTPPVTTLIIGEPKYASDKVYVTPDTPFTLEVTDAGSSVFSIAYRIFNSNYDSGWQTYTEPFNLAGLADGVYIIEFNSTDNLGNVEAINSVQVTLFSWNYVFEDSYGRGTILKINLAHKFFQFITPDKDYGIREATYMRQCGRTIIIQHCDNELRLITMALDTKLDFCIAIAWDKQTHKQYFLIDKVGKE